MELRVANGWGCGAYPNVDAGILGGAAHCTTPHEVLLIPRSSLGMVY